MVYKAHKKLAKQALNKPGVTKAYAEMGEEFILLREAVNARYQAGKTQEDVAKAMGTTTSVVGRLEAAGGKRKHSPTLATLRKYAHALGYDLQLRFVAHKR